MLYQLEVLSMKKRTKKHWYADFPPLLAILLLLLPTLFLGAMLTSSIEHLQNVKQPIPSQEKKLSTLKKEYQNIVPNKNDYKRQVFDLQGKQKELQDKYTKATTDLFKNPTPDNLTPQKIKSFYPYFGKKGAKYLRKDILQHSILTGEKTVVTFSDFDITNKVILIHIYTQYKLDPDLNTNTSGAAYFDVSYNFTTKQGTLLNAYIKDKEEN